jgi:prophage regulatory protein
MAKSRKTIAEAYKMDRKREAGSQAALAAGSSDGGAKRPSHSSAAGVHVSWQGDRLVTEDERKQLTGFCRGYWWKLERQGLVPRRIHVGQRKIGWLHSELQAWLQERAAARDADRVAGRQAMRSMRGQPDDSDDTGTQEAADARPTA